MRRKCALRIDIAAREVEDDRDEDVAGQSQSFFFSKNLLLGPLKFLMSCGMHRAYIYKKNKSN